jgi:ATP-dependent DNA ligase
VTRNRHHVNGTHAELAAALAALHRLDFIVDGEIFAFNDATTSFSRVGADNPAAPVEQVFSPGQARQVRHLAAR